MNIHGVFGGRMCSAGFFQFGECALSFPSQQPRKAFEFFFHSQNCDALYAPVNSLESLSWTMDYLSWGYNMGEQCAHPSTAAENHPFCDAVVTSKGLFSCIHRRWPTTKLSTTMHPKPIQIRRPPSWSFTSNSPERHSGSASGRLEMGKATRLLEEKRGRVWEFDFLVFASAWQGS